jgi:acyl transferase domain-containing protein
MSTIPTSPPTPLSRALETIRRLRAQLASQLASQQIAVVGVGMRFPGGIDSLDAYWQVLAEARDMVRPMPAARKAPFAAEWDTLPHKGGFLDDVTSFDAAFFGISPREARAIDPQHRLLLEVAWEALENAALPPDRISAARAALYIGITGQDYRDWQTGALDAYWATGNGHSLAAGRIAYAMGFTGPAIAVDTACSSGLVAVHLACQALRRGECDVAVAGGVNLILSPRSTRLIRETRALSPDGLCRTFDARANGFTRGEGCGVVVLKRLDHALRDGDQVRAVIRGSAVNQDGRSSGFTAPNVLSQIALIEAALGDAGLKPADIGLVEAHGTGTALGDPIEMEALVAALGRKNAGARLYVGSVKTNIGHLEAAAGVAGLLKAIACCTHRAVPPLVHYRTLNPRIDLSGTQITLPTALVPWKPDESGRFAGVSSFGLSGTNAHMIVGAADEVPRPEAGEVPVTGFEIAARTPEALRELAARFRDRLAALPADRYAAFAYTATFGRARHSVRAAITAADPTTAFDALDALARGAPSPAVTLGAGESPAGELPRGVVVLPHYPWQRQCHVPQTAVAGGAALAEPRRISCARDSVRRLVAAVLGHGDPGVVTDDTSFFDLGLDSIMAVDLARELSLAFGGELAFTVVFEHPTVAALAAVLVGHQRARAAETLDGAPVAVVTAAPGEPAREARRTPRVAFLFSCQGGQYFGMGRELYETEPVFRARIDACERIIAPLIGGSLAELMMHGADRDAVHQTRVTQPATVALQLALADLWSSWGVNASAVLGHSLGEVAAAIHAGVIDVEAGLALVAHRGRLMQSTVPGAMLSVSAPLAQVLTWIEGMPIDVAAINGPDAVVVSGARAAIEALTAELHATGITARSLAVSHASHSRLMDPIVPALHDAIAGLAFRAPRLPIIANLTGRIAGETDHDARYWCRHLREPVRFFEGAQALRALDIDVWLEVGPDRTLVNLLTATGLVSAGDAVASLRRSAGERASMLDAVRALRARGLEVAPGEPTPAAPRSLDRFESSQLHRSRRSRSPQLLPVAAPANQERADERRVA